MIVLMIKIKTTRTIKATKEVIREVRATKAVTKVAKAVAKVANKVAKVANKVAKVATKAAKVANKVATKVIKVVLAVEKLTVRLSPLRPMARKVIKVVETVLTRNLQPRMSHIPSTPQATSTKPSAATALKA